MNNNNYNLKRQKEVFGFTEEDVEEDLAAERFYSVLFYIGFIAILAAPVVAALQQLV